MRRQCNPRAFTLVEMVMVIALIAIAAGLAMPRFSTAAESNRVDVAARRVMADLATLRLAARASSATTTATFTPATNSYTLTGVARANGVNPIVKIGDFPYNCKITLPANAASASLSYNQYGVPTSELTVYVTSGKFRRTVSVDINTGTPLLTLTVGSTTVTIQ